jgi:DNA topoisomerase-2
MSKNKKFVKLTQIEHVLARSGMYIGSTELVNDDMWIYDETSSKIIKKKILFNAGLLKLFDEALVNARDAFINNSNTVDYIKVCYNKEENYISIENNGENLIPITFHDQYPESYIPSIIFGELLSGSNFDDNEERITGGLNGIGSKAVNIFSTRFIVDIVDAIRGKTFSQEWSNNMSSKTEPQVSKTKLKKSSIKITFYPDVARFGLKDLNNEHYELFYRRTIDIASICGSKIKVYFNNVEIKTNNFKSYISLYYPNETVHYDDSCERWNIGVIYKTDEQSNEIISFVNSIHTYKNGTHANYCIDSIVKVLITDYIQKKDKTLKISPALLKENLVFFINSTIVNPSFSSQSKDVLTTPVSKFGSKYTPNATFLKKLSKCGIVEQVIDLVKFKQSNTLKKSDGKKQVRITGIPKLDDANKAGTKESSKCSLILTEGDSAKTFAISGLSIIGRDYFGVFPLKGKLLNAREASPKQLSENDEINNLKQIIGLKHGVNYEDENNFNQLNYSNQIFLNFNNMNYKENS